MRTVYSEKALDLYPQLFEVVRSELVKTAEFQELNEKVAFLGKVVGAIKKPFQAFRTSKALKGLGDVPSVGNIRGTIDSGFKGKSVKDISQMTGHLEKYQKLMESEPMQLSQKIYEKRQMLGQGSGALGSSERLALMQEMDQAYKQLVNRYGEEGAEKILKVYGGKLGNPEDVAFLKQLQGGGSVTRQAEQTAAQQAAEQGTKSVGQELAEQTGQQGGGWLSDLEPWQQFALGAGAVGVPLAAGAGLYIKNRAEREARRAALAAGGMGLATGVMAGQIIPSVGQRLSNLGQRLVNFNAPRMPPVSYGY